MKHLRSKNDGWVYTYNDSLAARGDMEVFEWTEDVPERIPDLFEFLHGEKATAVEPARRGRKPKADAPAEGEQ